MPGPRLYVLMTNHVHLLLTPSRGNKRRTFDETTWATLRSIHQQNVPTNRSPLRREFSVLCNGRRQLFTSLPAIHRDEPGPGSDGQHAKCFQTNGLGEKNEIITPHTVYQALGENPEIRQQAYRELFRYELDPGVLEEIRRATNGNFALGSNRFNEQIAKVRGKRVTLGKAGRPRKERK